MGLWDDIVDVVEAVVNTLEGVVEAIAKAVKAGATVAGEIVSLVGSPLKFVVDGVAYLVGDLVGIHMRTLTVRERQILQGVYGPGFPVDKILITSINGVGDRPFTLPGSMIWLLMIILPGIGGLVALAGMIEHLQDKFLINVGKANFDNLVPAHRDVLDHDRDGTTLVHESCHVWQGITGAVSWLYVFNSLYYQAVCGTAGAYDIPGITSAFTSNSVKVYTVDPYQLKQFSAYHAEQQARLVEIWYHMGSDVRSFLYAYIRDNILTRNPSAHTNLSVPPKVISKMPIMANPNVGNAKL